jgi:hypothetical protein
MLPGDEEKKQECLPFIPGHIMINIILPSQTGGILLKCRGMEFPQNKRRVSSEGIALLFHWC